MGTIASDSSVGITLTAADSPLTVDANVTVANGTAITAPGNPANSYSIDNFATVSGAGSSYNGIQLGAATPVAHGDVTNEASGIISGDANGVAIYGLGAVTNQAGATIVGSNNDAISIHGSGSVINGGTLIAASAAIYMSGGSVTNLPGGTITGDRGVFMAGVGTVSNAGVIIGTGNSPYGAVTFFQNDAANRLITYASASFSGYVNGGTGVLELASSSSAGTLSGFGSGITNFGTVQFDPNSVWTLSGQVGPTGFDTIGFRGFAANDTIEITNFVATSGTFGSTGLVLTDSIGTHATLSFANSFSTSDFVVTNDGSNESFIVRQNLANSFTWNGGSADWTSATYWSPNGVPGAIDDVTIVSTGSAAVVNVDAAEFVDASNITLNSSDATLEIDGTLAAGGTLAINAGTVAVKGSLVAASIADNALLAFIGSNTLIGSPLQLAGTLQLQDAGIVTAATLTIGGGEVITQAGASATINSTNQNQESVVNQGSILANVVSGAMTIAPTNFTNNGTITVDNGDALTIAGAWSNSAGVIDLGTSGTLIMDGSFRTDGIGSILDAAGVTVAGNLDNTGFTLDVGQATQLGTVTLASTGVISNGTIVDHGSGFAFGNGTFSAVTFVGPLNLATTSDRLNIVGGLTVGGDGNINLTGGGDTILNFINSQTIDNATINLNSADSSNPLTEIDIQGATAEALTLGSNLTITSTVANTQAYLRSHGSDDTTVINFGTIIAAAQNGSFGVAPLDGFTNTGVISIDNGETFSIQPGSGIFDNSGSVSVNGGAKLEILSSDSITPPINNTGSISVASGTTLELGGYFTEASLGNVTNLGTTEIDGTLDAAGGTLALGPNTVLNQVLLAGNIRNGTVIANGALTVEAAKNASLLNLTYRGALDLASDSTPLTINEGVTITDSAGTGPGTINVTGRGDTLTLQNTLLAPNANQTLDNITITIGNSKASDSINASLPNGTLSVGAGATIVSSTTGAVASLFAGANSTIDFGGTLDAVAQGGTFTLQGGGLSTFDNNGVLLAGNGDTLNITTPIAGGTGVIDLATGGVANFTTSVTSGQTLAFTDATGTLRLHQPGSFAATVLGFARGNIIDLAGISADSATWSAGQFTVSNDGTALATLSLPGDYSGFDFSVATDNAGGSAVTITATCYAAGTRILTPNGEVAIEHLREGDLVRTVSGGTQPIRWIGHRRVNFTRHPNRGRILPVRISAHAFCRGRPTRDLLLSPDHAVFVEDVLIPIRHLLNGSTIAQVERRAITYYHIELPHHDVLLADGLPAESYLEAGARDAFTNGGGAIQLHAEFSPSQDHYAILWELHGYAPLVVTGEILEQVRRSLAVRAQMECGTARAA